MTDSDENSIETGKRWRQWYGFAKKSNIAEEIAQLLSRVNQDVSQKKPVCNASGQCCDFKAYGHRLYVTGLEMAWVINRLGDKDVTSLNTANNDTDRTAPEDAKVINSGGAAGDLALPQFSELSALICPFQIEGLCRIHEIRPMGCRLYFCDGSDDWQHERYEFYQSQIKKLHAIYDIDYAYMEWTVGLTQALRYKLDL